MPEAWIFRSPRAFNKLAHPGRCPNPRLTGAGALLCFPTQQSFKVYSIAAVGGKHRLANLPPKFPPLLVLLAHLLGAPRTQRRQIASSACPIVQAGNP
jgi:hypothetical protein